MKRLICNAVPLAWLLFGLSSGSAFAVDVQVSGGVITSGSAEVSSSTNSNFGYKVDSYTGTQYGLSLIENDNSYLMLNSREISGTADFLSGEMKRSDVSLTYSRGFKDNVSGYIGWKTGESRVTKSGTNYFNFSSSGPFVGATTVGNLSPSVVMGVNMSLQFITSGTYRPSYQTYDDKATISYGFGLGLGMAYLVNDHFSLGADYKYSLNAYSFKQECYSCTVGGVAYSYYSRTYVLDEKISHIELNAKYKF